MARYIYNKQKPARRGKKGKDFFVKRFSEDSDFLFLTQSFLVGTGCKNGILPFLLMSWIGLDFTGVGLEWNKLD